MLMGGGIGIAKTSVFSISVYRLNAMTFFTEIGKCPKFI
jgi:hypothetical protein